MLALGAALAIGAGVAAGAGGAGEGIAAIGPMAAARPAAASLSVKPTAGSAETDAALRQAYVRYLGGGRGDVEVHLSAAGDATHATTEPLGDGSYRCEVSGLGRAGETDPADAPEAAPLALVARLIHETTHCQTGPVAADLRTGESGPAAEAADLLVAMTLESIADARVVIEVARLDGLGAARAAVAHARPVRVAPKSAAHMTARALDQALQTASLRPHEIASPQQAFAASLAVGQRSAATTWAEVMTARRAAVALDAPAVSARRQALAGALARAEQAFGNGRFGNGSATLHASNDRPSSGDHHFYAGADGSVSTRPTLGAEGAPRADALAAMIDAPQPTETRLAVAWLQCQGELDSVKLPRATAAFARVIRHVEQAAPTAGPRAVQWLDRELAVCRSGANFADLVERVLDRAQGSSPAG